VVVVRVRLKSVFRTLSFSGHTQGAKSASSDIAHEFSGFSSLTREEPLAAGSIWSSELRQ
jgi:hypothetical protein